MWKEVPGTNGYYLVSTKGEVKSAPRTIRVKRKGQEEFSRLVPGKLMTPYNSIGYRAIHLRINNITIRFRVHRLVALTFIPNPDNKTEVNHKDGDRANNNITNLEWVTHQEQMQHAHRTGLTKPAKGERNHKAILREVDIPEIRKRIAIGEDQTSIARSYGVRPDVINQIKAGKTWKHVPCPPEHDFSKVPMHRKGRDNVRTKLTERQVIEIKRRFRQGESNVSIAKRFSVSRQGIGSIRRGVTWKHIPN